MQKRAARVITGSGYEIRSREIFERLGLEPIENILKKREIVMTFKGHSRRAFRVHVRNV